MGRLILFYSVIFLLIRAGEYQLLGVRTINDFPDKKAGINHNLKLTLVPCNKTVPSIRVAPLSRFEDTIVVPAIFDLFSLGESLLIAKGPKKALDSLSLLEKYYKSPEEKNIFYQVMMTFQSITGNNKSSLMYESKAFTFKDTSKYIFNNSYKAVSAIDCILSRCKDSPVVLFNEAHNRGQHRAFIRSILKEFFANGFRYLLVEAVDYSDSLLNERKFPIRKTGLYINEPTFGQMI